MCSISNAVLLRWKISNALFVGVKPNNFVAITQLSSRTHKEKKYLNFKHKNQNNTELLLISRLEHNSTSRPLCQIVLATSSTLL